MKGPRIVLASFLGLTLCSWLLAESWKPAQAPLMTRWAKDVSPSKVHPEYPRPQMVRSDWLNLNGLWQLASAGPDDAAPTGKDLPQQILVPFPVESALSGVMRPAERLWYRRIFQVPEAWKGRRVLLHFGAVDWEATVLINGRSLGTHRGGYDAFSYDITDALTPTGDQELLVKVFDPTDAGSQPRGKQVRKPGGIFYTPVTGIWQTVWLEPVPQARIAEVRLTPDVDGSCLRAVVQGAGTGAQDTVQLVARDGDVEVSQASGKAGSEITLAIPKDKLKLWSPSSPHLYDLSMRLKQGDATVDEVQSYFGMRKIELAKDDKGLTRMRLNGEFLFQVGPLDQGFWPDGIYTAPTDEALRYDIEVTKQLGYNMTRKHVKVEPQRWYYWCDKLGCLVWQDMPSGDNKSPESRIQFEAELREMIDEHRNHPSIIMWVVFNEGWGQHDTPRYVAQVKKLDPSRMVSNASGWTDMNVGDILDIHVYPGPGAPKPESQRAGVLGEFGGLGLGVDGHTWTSKTWGYRGMSSKEELTRRYVKLLSGVWGLKDTQGLCAAVYTQITDVETECNGLLTYDREIVKVDLPKVAAANQGKIPKIKIRAVVPTSQAEGVAWRYTLEKPDSGWYQPGFDDSAWKQGPGGFGTKGTPGSVVRTVWNTGSIWLRREFELPETKTDKLSLLLHHDEDVEVYINGVLAAKAEGFTADYEDLPLSDDARRAMKPGKNLLAVHCRQTQGGQYIDLGIVEVTEE